MTNGIGNFEHGFIPHKDMSDEKSERELIELLAHDLAGVEDYVEMREIPYWIQVLAEKIIEKGWRKP